MFIFGSVDPKYTLDLPPHPGCQSPPGPRIITFLRFGDPNLNRHFLESWVGGVDPKYTVACEKNRPSIPQTAGFGRAQVAGVSQLEGTDFSDSNGKKPVKL